MRGKMKNLLLGAFVALLSVSCGTSPKGGDIDVVGRWYVYTDDSRTEVDSTAFFDFNEDQHYARRYHDAGSLEVGTYACSDKTKADYGDKASKRVSITTQGGDQYFVDIVKDNDTYMFDITYQQNDKETIIYCTKEEKKGGDEK